MDFGWLSQLHCACGEVLAICVRSGWWLERMAASPYGEGHSVNV